jgi:hypothetical protein
VRDGDKVKIRVELPEGQAEYADVSPTEAWCAYQMIKPTKQLQDEGADADDPGICGINGRIQGGWKFQIHPAVANTLLAREAMRLDMSGSLDDSRLPPLPPIYSTYRWYDVPAVIYAKNGRILVKPAREPFDILLRLQLWDEMGPVPVETGPFVAAVSASLDAFQRIDRFARVLALLRWLDQEKVLRALPEEVRAAKFNVPAQWRAADVFAEPAAQRALGRFSIPAKGEARALRLKLEKDREYTFWLAAREALEVEIRDPSGTVAGPTLSTTDKFPVSERSFRPTESGVYQITATARDNPVGRQYALVVGEKETIKELKGKIGRDSPKDKTRKLLLSEPVRLELSEGCLCGIAMRSSGFQTYLRLEDQDGKTIRETNAPANEINVDSMIVLTVGTTGVYRIICGAEDDKVGSFTVSVTKHRTLYPRMVSPFAPGKDR